MSRHDYRLSLDPQAIQLAEEAAYDRKTFPDIPSDRDMDEAAVRWENAMERWSA